MAPWTTTPFIDDYKALLEYSDDLDFDRMLLVGLL